MNCRSFERWLDEGMPPGTSGRARSHAASCSECGERYAVALALESALEGSRAQTPDGFTASVMTRVASTPRPAPAPLIFAPAVLPWWTRATAEPATAVSLALAALVIWRLDVVWAAASDVGPQVALGVAWLVARLGFAGAVHDPAARISLWLGALVLSGLASVAIFTFTEASVRRLAAGGLRARR